LSKVESVSHRMSLLTVVERLRSQHGQTRATSWPLWSSRERDVRGAESGSIFGAPSQSKSRLGFLATRIRRCATDTQRLKVKAQEGPSVPSDAWAIADATVATARRARQAAPLISR
jgi:hypothetical protein